MKLENNIQFRDIVDAADFILVGLGREWVVTYDEIYEDLKRKVPVLAGLLDYIIVHPEYESLTRLVEWYYDLHFIPSRLEQAYQALYQIVNQKNYFILSLTVDSYLQRFQFKSDRYVNPCGTLALSQCNSNCQDELMQSKDVLGKIVDYIDGIINQQTGVNDLGGQMEIVCFADTLMKYMEELYCNKCHERIVFNTLDAVKYNENGYLDKWQLYMKWLQGTLNKKLCIIEAGAGMELPSVIRWPFEKTAFYNRKAVMIRMHHKFYQVNEEISDRAYGLEKNAVDFFAGNSWR